MWFEMLCYNAAESDAFIIYMHENSIPSVRKMSLYLHVFDIPIDVCWSRRGL
jgi:hypothetical protein